MGGSTYSYNSNKCLTGDGVWTYTFDTENHLLTANKTGVSASLVYDPMHRQSQKTVGSTKSRCVYSGWQRIADYDGTSGALQNRYVYGTSLDEPLITVSSSGTLTFLHHDKMGSIVATSNNSGAVTNKNKFSPFGEITTLAGTTFGFTGQRYDSELGLGYFKGRYYSPKLGRFLQPDPVGYIGGDLNLYAYVRNSPQKFSDPMGMQRKWVPGTGDPVDSYVPWWENPDGLSYKDYLASLNITPGTIDWLKKGAENSDLFKDGEDPGSGIQSDLSDFWGHYTEETFGGVTWRFYIDGRLWLSGLISQSDGSSAEINFMKNGGMIVKEISASGVTDIWDSNNPYAQVMILPDGRSYTNSFNPPAQFKDVNRFKSILPDFFNF